MNEWIIIGFYVGIGLFIVRLLPFIILFSVGFIFHFLYWIFKKSPKKLAHEKRLRDEKWKQDIDDHWDLLLRDTQVPCVKKER